MMEAAKGPDTGFASTKVRKAKEKTEGYVLSNSRKHKEMQSKLVRGATPDTHRRHSVQHCRMGWPKVKGKKSPRKLKGEKSPMGFSQSFSMLKERREEGG